MTETETPTPLASGPKRRRRWVEVRIERSVARSLVAVIGPDDRAELRKYAERHGVRPHILAEQNRRYMGEAGRKEVRRLLRQLILDPTNANATDEEIAAKADVSVERVRFKRPGVLRHAAESAAGLNATGAEDPEVPS